ATPPRSLHAALPIYAAQEAIGYLTTLQTGVITNTAERADGGWHSEWAALRGLLRNTGAVAEILTELTAGLQVFPRAMRNNLEIRSEEHTSELQSRFE